MIIVVTAMTEAGAVAVDVAVAGTPEVVSAVRDRYRWPAQRVTTKDRRFTNLPMPACQKLTAIASRRAS